MPQFHTDTAIDGTTLRFSQVAASEHGGGFTKGEEVIDPLADPELIEPLLLFLLLASNGKLSFLFSVFIPFLLHSLETYYRFRFLSVYVS